jgi:hypothetical protein
MFEFRMTAFGSATQRIIASLSMILIVGYLTGCVPDPPPDPDPPPLPLPLPCNGQRPNGQPCFLSKKGPIQYPPDPDPTHRTEPERYYQTIIPDPEHEKTTLAEWKSANGFGPADGSGDARAIYYQEGDLAIGRDMNCKSSGPEECRACTQDRRACIATCKDQFDFCDDLPKNCVREYTSCLADCPECDAKCSSTKIACYVTNYGPAPGSMPNQDFPNGYPDENAALQDAVAAKLGQAHRGAFATVAMEYTSPASASNSVRFYVFGPGPDEKRAGAAVLDSEGAKDVPRMCMACHGGSYNENTHSVRGASFLPFDLSSFHYSRTPGFTRADQEEEFRKLNAIVRDTNPNPLSNNDPIRKLIDVWYPTGVYKPNSKAHTELAPPGWRGQESGYFSLVAPYCRACHIASNPLDFSSYENFDNNAESIRADSCRSYSMSHAEVPFKRLWAGTALHILDNPTFLLPSLSGTRCSAAPPQSDTVECFVFNDGGQDVVGPSDAIFASASQQACTPDLGNGTCRRWFGDCRTTNGKVPVTFAVFDDGVANRTLNSGAVYFNSPELSCIPGAPAAGECRKWFGEASTNDGHAVDCFLFDDGYENMVGPTRAIYFRGPNQFCMPDGTDAGTCRKWFGRCQVP